MEQATERDVMLLIEKCQRIEDGLAVKYNELIDMNLARIDEIKATTIKLVAQIKGRNRSIDQFEEQYKGQVYWEKQKMIREQIQELEMWNERDARSLAALAKDSAQCHENLHKISQLLG